jgi:hypothetical protein
MKPTYKQAVPALIPILLLLSHCGSTAQPRSPYSLPPTVDKSHDSVNVVVSPAIELMAIVQTVGAYQTTFPFLMSADTCSYRKDVERAFGPYAHHPAVAMVERLSRRPRKLNFSAPSAIMLYTDDSLTVRRDLVFDEFVLSRIDGMDSLRVFLDLLKDFARISSFNDFFLSHSAFYQQEIDSTIGEMDSVNYVRQLEAFYGRRLLSYNIVLVPLYSFVGYGNSIVHKNGRREAFDIMGPQKTTNDTPSFGDTRYLKYMIRHEFSHPYINPLTEKYWDLVSADSANFSRIPEVAKKRVCGEWQECVDEFIVRAVSTHLAQQESPVLGKGVYEREKALGVCNLDDLLGKIQYYEQNRSRYPTLEAFYRVLLESFHRMEVQ